MYKETNKSLSHRNKSQKGFSLVETIVVFTVVTVLAAIAIPQLIGSRRAIRMAAVPQTIGTQLRFARQQAMSQQVRISLVYDDNPNAKNIRIFGGTFGLQNAPTNKITFLGGEGLEKAEIRYGIPVGCPIAALPDGTTQSVLDQSNLVTIAFYPDGTVHDTANNILQDYALYLYNDKSPKETSAAISVLGSGGRVKIWRCNSAGTAYVE